MAENSTAAQVAAQQATSATVSNPNPEMERRALAAEARVGKLEQENDILHAQVRAWKGQTTRARSEVEKLKRPEGAELRRAGPMPDLALLSGEERHAAIRGALAFGEGELVFSDGKREIRELAPLKIGADRLVDRPGRGLVLDHEPILEPGAMEKPEVKVAGFALFNGEGHQIGYSPLPEPITVPKGGSVLVPAGSIRF